MLDAYVYDVEWPPEITSLARATLARIITIQIGNALFIFDLYCVLGCNESDDMVKDKQGVRKQLWHIFSYMFFRPYKDKKTMKDD